MSLHYDDFLKNCLLAPSPPVWKSLRRTDGLTSGPERSREAQFFVRYAMNKVVELADEQGFSVKEQVVLWLATELVATYKDVC